MASKIKDLRDIPELFVTTEGEDKMVGRRKTTPDRLDKIIQFIWDYQDKHGGDTPMLETISRHVGISGQGIAYFINILIEEGRLNKISGRPFRATITNDRKNLSAVDRFKRIRALQEQTEADERDRIRAEQVRNAETEQRGADKEALFAAAVQPATQVANVPSPTKALERERPAIAANWEPQAGTAAAPRAPAVERFMSASSEYQSAQRELNKTEMARLIKVADSSNLVYELITRGYTVSKNR